MTPAPHPTVAARPLVLFDGPCNLCHQTVRWLLARDKHERLDFASLQSAAARDALTRADYREALPDSIVFVDRGEVHVLSSAAIRIARTLGWPWSLLGLVWIVPSPLRNAVYKWIAANRLRWFGQNDACSLPDPNQAQRFLDAEELRSGSDFSPLDPDS